jgi:hypothetical protein
LAGTVTKNEKSQRDDCLGSAEAFRNGPAAWVASRVAALQGGVSHDHPQRGPGISECDLRAVIAFAAACPA